MEFIKELFEKYEIRKSKQQKTEFINWVSMMAQDKGYKCNVEKGSLGVRNIVIGDVDKAKVVFTAHYDTCATMIIPNFITPKNIWVYLLYQIVVTVLLFLPSSVLFFVLSSFFNVDAEVASMVAYLGLIVMLWLLIAGPANKHTANDNTSGVATILGLLDSIPDNKKNDVLLILFDLEEAGLLGSSSFASKHKKVMTNKLLINYDCVSDGDKMLFVFNKKNKKYISCFEEAFKSTDKVTTEIVSNGVFYPSDQANFPLGVGVCSLKTNNLFKSGYIDRIHTKNDTVFRKENIEFLINGSVSLINDIENMDK